MSNDACNCGCNTKPAPEAVKDEACTCGCSCCDTASEDDKAGAHA